MLPGLIFSLRKPVFPASTHPHLPVYGHTREERENRTDTTDTDRDWQMDEHAPFDEWSRRLRASDRDACTELFDALHDPLLHYAARLTNEETAYDVVQEAFVSLWQMRASIDPDRSLRALLYTLVRNEALNERRTMRRREDRHAEYSPSTHPPSPADRLETQVLRDRFRQWIEDLPERQREAFRLSRFDDLTHEEIADVMGIATRTVTNHVTQALQTLRERLDAYRSTSE